MSYYFIASIKIYDQIEYQKYIDKVSEIFRKYKGQYLAVDNNPDIIEGNWEYDRLVLVKFDNQEDFKNWYYSTEYQEILKYRLSAAKCDTIFVTGLDGL